MKTIGIIGGLSTQSTLKYYEWLDADIYARTNGKHNAKILISSVDFQEFCGLKKKGDWAAMEKILCGEAVRLQEAGADIILLATNTMHKMADQITAALSIPFVHLAEATANRIVADGRNKIGLLGTRYTMEQDFYKKKLEEQGIEVIVPDTDGVEIVNGVIYDELVHGTVSDGSRMKYLRVIEKLRERGAQGVILGCTEITMLVKDTDTTLPLYDTTRIHVEEAAKFAMKGCRAANAA